MGESQVGHSMYEWPDRPHEPVTVASMLDGAPRRP